MSHAPATAVVTTIIASPVGPIRLTATQDVLTGLTILPGAALEADKSDNPLLAQAQAQLAAYFAGERRIFDLPLAPAATMRGAELRNGIAAIPYGDTLSYGALATIVESGPRAVGQACRRNPFPILIPCHRVTSAKGAPEHYSGGNGVTTKTWLNRFEQHTIHKETS